MKTGSITIAAMALALASIGLGAVARPYGGMGHGMGHGGIGNGGMAQGHASPPPAIHAPPGGRFAPPPRRVDVAEARAFRRSFFPPVIRESLENDRFRFAHEGNRGDRRQFAFWPNGYGWWGGYDGSYYPPVDYRQPADQNAEPAPVVYEQPPTPICPELLTWSPKLGRATRERLCE